MKLSELIKNEIAAESVKPKAPEPLPFPPSPPPARPVSAPAPPAAPAPPVSSPEIVQAAVEAEVRASLEKEFMEKLHQMEKELRRITEENLKGQELLMQERQVESDKERQRLLKEMADLKTVNENLASQQTSQAQEFERRLQEERKRFEEQMRQNASARTGAESEELHKKLFQKEQELLEKQRKLEEMAQSREAAPVLPPVPPPAPQQKYPARPETVLPAFDPKAEERLRKLYQALVQTGERVFQEMARGQVDLGFLNKVLSEMIEAAQQNDQDLLAIILEPYPNVDYFTYHCANCSIFSIIMGLEMGLLPEELKELALAGFVHDAGLLGIKENLDYPKQLAPDIKAEIMKHPQRTADMMGDAVSQNVKTALLQHHETMNGKGYPAGLTGEGIHPYAKIIHIADSFEAMTHHRPYRQRPLEVSEALKEMVDRGRGIYDRDAMKALMNRIGLYPIMSLVELSNKKIARVIRQNRKFPLSPFVQIEFDEEGNKLREPLVLDLAKNQLVHILGAVGNSSSMGKERIEKHRSETKKAFKILDLVPLLFAAALLAGLIYLVLKL